MCQSDIHLQTCIASLEIQLCTQAIQQLQFSSGERVKDYKPLSVSEYKSPFWPLNSQFIPSFRRWLLSLSSVPWHSYSHSDELSELASSKTTPNVISRASHGIVAIHFSIEKSECIEYWSTGHDLYRQENIFPDSGPISFFECPCPIFHQECILFWARLLSFELECSRLTVFWKLSNIKESYSAKSFKNTFSEPMENRQIDLWVLTPQRFFSSNFQPQNNNKNVSLLEL